MSEGLRPHKAELLSPGTRIGRYHLLQRLAVGGMAELYLACAKGLAGFQKVVVVKHVLPHLAQDPEFVAMFLNEARIAATLAHPNIVHVTDIGETSGDYFYAMEFVHGRNARELLRAGASRGGLPLDVALTVAIATASALEHTHSARDVDGSELGLIHRDVSPANILVSYEGTAKLTDFGIAKASEKSTETIGGGLKGKVGYMSPEQCRGDALDQRSDLFALGVVLFELTTCQRLLYGDNDFAVLNNVLRGDFDRPSDRVPDYPDELERIVQKALAVDRADRYGSATKIREDLEAFAHDARLRTTPATVASWMSDQFGSPPPPKVEVVEGHRGGPAVPTLVVTVRTEEPLEPGGGSEPLKPKRSDAPGHRWPWVAGIAAGGLLLGTVAFLSSSQHPRTLKPGLGFEVPSRVRTAEAQQVVQAQDPVGPSPIEEAPRQPAPAAAKKRAGKKRRPRKRGTKPRRSGKRPNDMDNPFPVPL